MDIETEYEQSSGLRIPPHSGEAEQAVLGSLMLDEKAWEAVSERVIDNDFYQQNHRLIYRAIEQLVAEEQFVDLVTVAAKLEELGHIEQAGGRPYLHLSTTSIPSAETGAAEAAIGRVRSRQERVVGAAGKIRHTGYEP